MMNMNKKDKNWLIRSALITALIFSILILIATVHSTCSNRTYNYEDTRYEKIERKNFRTNKNNFL